MRHRSGREIVWVNAGSALAYVRLNSLVGDTTVYLEGSGDGDNWATIRSFCVEGPEVVRKVINEPDEFLRLRATNRDTTIDLYDS